MRLIGQIPNESSASTFSDYLYVQGIANEVEAEKDGWAVWIHSEDEWPKAKEMLALFLGNPSDPKFSQEAGRATELRAAAEAKVDEIEKRIFDRTKVFRASMPYGVGGLTAILIGLCLTTHLLRNAGYEEQILRELFMTATERVGEFFQSARGLPEIRQGEFWRLFTPVMVHGSWLHVLLNMMWLLDLGSMIEGRKGTGRLGLMIVVLAVFSNLGQFYLKGPIFCGMSGVVYGLMGYVWMKSRYDLASGLYMHPHTVVMMIGWFFLCLIGAIPGIANGAHAAGLGLGMAWGYLSSLPTMRRKSE